MENFTWKFFHFTPMTAIYVPIQLIAATQFAYDYRVGVWVWVGGSAVTILHMITFTALNINSDIL